MMGIIHIQIAKITSSQCVKIPTKIGLKAINYFLTDDMYNVDFEALNLNQSFEQLPILRNHNI